MLGWILALAMASWTPPVCLGDANGDRVVSILDGSVIASNYLRTVEPGTRGDLNEDGVVNALDADIWAANFGHICPLPPVRNLTPDR